MTIKKSLVDLGVRPGDLFCSVHHKVEYYVVALIAKLSIHRMPHVGLVLKGEPLRPKPL